MEKGNWNKSLLDKIEITELIKVRDYPIKGYKWYDENNNLLTSNDYNDKHIFLCLHEDGKLTDKFNRTVRKEAITIPQSRFPETNEEFSQLIDKVTEFKVRESKTEQPYASIFEDSAFEIFEKWMCKSDEVGYKKLSFIIQKLKEENKLRNTNFKHITEWALSNNFLDKENYDKLYIDRCFTSPSKILTKGRIKLYNVIIGK